MKIPDVNVLIYASNASVPQHQRARAWLASRAGSDEATGYAWIVLIAFIRICTRPGALAQPMQVEEALAAVRRLLSQPGAEVVGPGPGHAPLLGRLLLAAGTAGNLTNDAHLAAIAIEHGATLASFDRDFERFAGLAFEHLG